MVARKILNSETRTTPLMIVHPDTESVEFVSQSSIEESAQSFSENSGSPSANLPRSNITSPKSETGTSHQAIDKETQELQQQSLSAISQLFKDRLFTRFRIHQTGLK